MGYLHCCWQPNSCAKLFSVLLPTHLRYWVKSRLSRALLPTHLQFGLFALLLATQFLCQAVKCAVTNPFTLFGEIYANQGTVTNPFTIWAIYIAVGNPMPVLGCLVCSYQPIYTIWWNLSYPGYCYQPNLQYGLFSLLMAIQSTVAKPFTLQREFPGQTEVLFSSFLSGIFTTVKHSHFSI